MKSGQRQVWAVGSLASGKSEQWEVWAVGSLGGGETEQMEDWAVGRRVVSFLCWRGSS